MQYFKSLFISSPIKYDEGFEQFKKTPILMTVKDSKKRLLSSRYIEFENYVEYDQEPNFAIFTGKINNILLIDFDTTKKINFNTLKIDGIQWFEKEFGKITDLFGLVTETPSGGIHAYCLYTEFLSDTSVGLDYKIGEERKSIAIDILSNGGVGYQGRHYKVIQNNTLKEIPKNFLNFLKTLNYVPHMCAIDDSYSNSIYTLCSESHINVKELLIPEYIETPQLDLIYNENYFNETKMKLKIVLKLTEEYISELKKIDDIIIDYIYENRQFLLKRKYNYTREYIKNNVYHSFIRKNKYDEDILKLKLNFNNKGIPMFKVLNKEGQELIWINSKHPDKYTTFDLSFLESKAEVKAKCEGLWNINDNIYCTFQLIKLQLV